MTPEHLSREQAITGGNLMPDSLRLFRGSGKPHQASQRTSILCFCCVAMGDLSAFLFRICYLFILQLY